VNLYAYVGNDPVDGTDPSGTQIAGTFSIERACRSNASCIEGYREGQQEVGEFALDSAPVTGEIRATDSFLKHPTWMGAAIVASSIVDLGGAARVIARFGKQFKKAGKIVSHALPNGGVALQAHVAARDIPGSKAVFEKQIGADGRTVLMTKTTYDSKGNIVHIRDLMSSGPKEYMTGSRIPK